MKYQGINSSMGAFHSEIDRISKPLKCELENFPFSIKQFWKSTRSPFLFWLAQFPLPSSILYPYVYRNVIKIAHNSVEAKTKSKVKKQAIL